MTSLPPPGLHFSLSTPISTRFGPRVGHVVFRRPGLPDQKIETPGILTTTSRGVVPHLSRDHCRLTKPIQWVHVPFETFLEYLPPVPTLQRGNNPIHTFLGFPPTHHVLSMSVRDPYDGRELPANGNGHIAAWSIRGVRKITPSDWRSYVLACKPDVVVALSDTPFTNPPYSQKRLTKSIERSTAWLADLLRPVERAPGAQGEEARAPDILVHMPGATSIPARRAFSESLIETLYGKDAELVKPLRSFDEGVTGYTFDLVPLRLSLEASAARAVNAESASPTPHAPAISLDGPNAATTTLANALAPSVSTEFLIPLIKTSLAPLPTTKLRLVNSPKSPHEILRLILTVGIDIFDAHWAQRAADVGIALDFRFPLGPLAPALALASFPITAPNATPTPAAGSPRRRAGKLDLGHNLYNNTYAHDFSRLSSDTGKQRTICPCTACSPAASQSSISHSAVDVRYSPAAMTADDAHAPFTRAYLHHLLHTHEMSAHSLLVMHNLAVFSAFFAGVRGVLRDADGEEAFARAVAAFEVEYDEGMAVFAEAEESWQEVELARGKGRLAREKAKQEGGTLATAMEV